MNGIATHSLLPEVRCPITMSPIPDSRIHGQHTCVLCRRKNRSRLSVLSPSAEASGDDSSLDSIQEAIGVLQLPRDESCSPEAQAFTFFMIAFFLKTAEVTISGHMLKLISRAPRPLMLWSVFWSRIGMLAFFLNDPVTADIKLGTPTVGVKSEKNAH